MINYPSDYLKLPNKSLNIQNKERESNWYPHKNIPNTQTDERSVYQRMFIPRTPSPPIYKDYYKRNPSSPSNQATTEQKPLPKDPIVLPSYPNHFPNIPDFAKNFPVEYCSDIEKDLINDSRKQDYSYELFKSTQKTINYTMRSVGIDWWISLHDYYKWSEYSLFHAISYIDRYLSKENIKLEELQLLVITALYIAMKYNERKIVKGKKLSENSMGSYSKKEIIYFEMKVLMTLDYKIGITTQFHIYEYMRLYFEFTRMGYYWGWFLLNAFSVDERSLKYKPEIICKAVCFIVITNKQEEVKSRRRINYKNDRILTNCINDIVWVSDQWIRSNYQGVIQKFTAEEYCNISALWLKNKK